MGFIITTAFAVLLNILYSTVSLNNSGIKKGIKTFTVEVENKSSNSEPALVDALKSNVVDVLKNTYKLKESQNGDASLTLKYIILGYSSEENKKDKDNILVKFRFSLKYDILGKSDVLQNLNISINLKKTDSQDIKDIFNKLVVKHLDEFVYSYFS